MFSLPTRKIQKIPRTLMKVIYEGQFTSISFTSVPLKRKDKAVGKCI
jgi:hypothetical protein